MADWVHSGPTERLVLGCVPGIILVDSLTVALPHQRPASAICTPLHAMSVSCSRPLLLLLTMRASAKSPVKTFGLETRSTERRSRSLLPSIWLSSLTCQVWSPRFSFSSRPKHSRVSCTPMNGAANELIGYRSAAAIRGKTVVPIGQHSRLSGSRTFAGPKLRKRDWWRFRSHSKHRSHSIHYKSVRYRFQGCLAASAPGKFSSTLKIVTSGFGSPTATVLLPTSRHSDRRPEQFKACVTRY